MCLIIRHNKVSIEWDEDKPPHPAIPRKPTKICVIAPALYTVIDDNAITVKTKIRSLGSAKKASLECSQNLDKRNIDTRGEATDTLSLTKADDGASMLAGDYSQQGQEVGRIGAIAGDSNEKQQMKLLDEQNTAMQKFQDIKLKLNQAKKNFQDVSSLLQHL